MKTPERILITGACGYVGAALVRRLSKEVEGVVIRMLDNMSSGSFNALVDLPMEGHYQFIEADILNPTQLEYSLQDIDTVIHLAAVVRTPLSFDNPSWLDQVNHWGTAHLINACIESGVKNFIYLSSSSVYGPGTGAKEDDPPKPLGSYANSKLSAENYIRKNAGVINYTILRSGTIYGPSEVLRVESFVNRLVFMAGTKKKITVLGEGDQERPVIYIDDCCSVICDILKNPDEYINGTFNLAEGNYSVNEIAEEIQNLKNNIKIHYTDQDIRTHYSFNMNTDLFSSSGYTFNYDIRSGLKTLLGQFKGFEEVR